MTNLTANDVVNIKKLYSNLVKAELDGILNLAEPSIVKIKDIEDQLNIDENFNIFTAIAEKYRHENLHSDLLKVILGNEKNNIGNREIFYKFLKHIGIKEENRNKYFSDYDSIKFEREYPIAIPLKSKDEEDEYERGLIDLLIYTDDACIIIENKVNGAPDQPNQLGKYYMHMKKNENKKVLKIVYLTKEQNINLSSILNKYNFTKYAPGYNDKNDIIQKINNLLITLPCVTMDNNGKSFTNFLNDITLDKDELDNTTDKNTTDAKKVFIDQYKSLITSIGGQVLMSEPEKNFIESFMNDKDKIQSAEKFKKIWEHRAGIIGTLLVQDWEFIYNTTDSKMQPSLFNNEKDVCVKQINNELGIYYSYNYDIPNNNINIDFGFCSYPEGQQFEESLKNKLVETFKSSLSDSCFDFGSIGKVYKNQWVYAHVKDLHALTYDEIKEELKGCLETLEDGAKDVLGIK